MEDDLKYFVKQGVQIRFTKLKMEDDLKYFVEGSHPQLFENGRQPQIIC
jgi:hypothetical protein